MSTVLEAKEFIFAKVIDPALNSSQVSPESKRKIKRTKLWVNNCKKIGDIYDYISRYSGEADKKFTDVYKELKKLSMTPIEDIIDSFAKKFSDNLNDRFGVEDLKVTEAYSSWDICIISKTYNMRQGIYLVNDGDIFNAILTKVTLMDGSYKNEWLDEDTLKHYMKNRLENYNENNSVNRAVINSKVIPIYVFIKDGKKCTFKGKFKFDSKSSDESGAKWFILKRLKEDADELKSYQEQFEKEVSDSSKLTNDEIKQKMQSYPETPIRKSVMTYVFERNPYVVHQVLIRANGSCEICGKEAPFIRKKGNAKGKPYLEVHHKKQLSDNGKDTVENAVALCPNCHRKEHFG